MGLSASQARMLSLTARLSDLELRAQTIANAKIRLSDESAGASKKYSDALDKQTLKIYSGLQNDGTDSYIDATAANLTTYNAISSTDKQRFIKDISGATLISDKAGNAYNSCAGNFESFLNGLGYTQYTSGNLKTGIKDNFTADLSSKIAATSATIGLSSTTGKITYTANSPGFFSAQSTAANTLSQALNLAYSYKTNPDAGTLSNLETTTANLSINIASLNAEEETHTLGTEIGALRTLSDGAISDEGLGQIDNAIAKLQAIDLYSFNILSQDPDIVTYTATVTPSEMALNLQQISSTLGIIPKSYDSSSLQTYIAQQQGYMSSFISQLAGSSTISTSLAQNIFGTINSISTPAISSMINSSNLTTAAQAYKNDTGAINYYKNVFDQISQGGGYKAISDKNLNSSEWLQSQIDCGNIYLYEYDSTAGSKGTGDYINVCWNSGYATLSEVTNKIDTAKAESEYETTMANIQSKDKRFDMQLSQIDTEHNATQTEIDSVKKVMNKNIERSFKIFDA